MATKTSTLHAPSEARARRAHLMHPLAPAGRALFGLIFVIAGFGHFKASSVAYAASQGVPAPGLLVPLSGLIAIVGGLSVILGYHAKVGAWLLVLFLLPVTLIMHRFWTIADPMTARLQEVMFLKNLSMLGGALLLAFFGAGPISLDRARRFTGEHRRKLERNDPGEPPTRMR